MRKALHAAGISLRLYMQSGQFVLPLLGLISFLLVFYHIRPFSVVGSYSISTTVALILAAWFGISFAWSDEPMLSQILCVKVGMARFYVAQRIIVFGVVATAGLSLAVFPAIGSLLFPDFYTRTLTLWDVISALLLHVAASICGCGFGQLFHPRLIHDRKLAYLFCLLAVLLSTVSGKLGIPLPIRLLLPPLFDSLTQIGHAEQFSAAYTALFLLWFVGYGFLCACVQTWLMCRRKFS